MTAALRLLEQLLACRSITPKDDGCQALIAQHLTVQGFDCEPMQFGPDDAAVHNLWATHQGEEGPVVVLAGHTDVVPPGPIEHWRSDPFVPTYRDGRLYARGAADMKAAVAAMVVAAGEFVSAHPRHRGTVAVLLTSDEEGPATHGTTRVIETLRARGQRLDACLIGEPTSVERLGDTIKNGRRGTLSARLQVLGVQGHVAYPYLARNPLHEFAPALAELVSTRWDDGNPHFPPTSFQVSNLHAGAGVGNVIPGEAWVDFNFRFSTESTPEQLQQRVADVLQRHRVEHRIEWRLGGMPFLTPVGRLAHVLSAAIEAECGLRPELATTGGTSDGRFIATLCPEVIEFGVCNATAHQVDESVPIDQIEPLKAIYRRTLEGLLA